MKNTTDKPTESSPSGAKPGLFARLVRRVDEAMKRKADEQARQGCCSGKDKGGKCC